MRTEFNKDIAVCPYTRRLKIIGEDVLILCGATSRRKPRLLKHEVPSLKRCPIYGEGALGPAYSHPSIVEFKYLHTERGFSIADDNIWRIANQSGPWDPRDGRDLE